MTNATLCCKCAGVLQTNLSVEKQNNSIPTTTDVLVLFSFNNFYKLFISITHTLVLFSPLSSETLCLYGYGHFHLASFPLFQNPMALSVTWFIFAPSLNNTSAMVFWHYCCFISNIVWRIWEIFHVSHPQWFLWSI